MAQQAPQAYDKKLPPADVKNEFHIEVEMNYYEVTVSVIDEVTKNEWFAHYLPKSWTGNPQDAEGVYNFLHEELNKEPANWVQLPPFKKDQPLNIIIGDSNGKHYKLAIPPKK